jgi:hypothetical protein
MPVKVAPSLAGGDSWATWGVIQAAVVCSDPRWVDVVQLDPPAPKARVAFTPPWA